MLPNERRFNRRSRTDTQGRTISGYAAIFNSPTDIGGQFSESIAPGAFSRALRDKHDVRLLINHDPNLLLSRTANGTLTLSQDVVGLHFRARLPETSAANDLLALLRSQTMSQCSFGFVVPDGGDSWSKKLHNGVIRDYREIHDCDLHDVSCVTYAAYDATSAGVDDEEEEDNNRLAMAAVAGRTGAPMELRSRIANAVAARDRLKRGPSGSSIAARLTELAALVEADDPGYPAERTQRLGAEFQAERILEGLT